MVSRARAESSAPEPEARDERERSEAADRAMARYANGDAAAFQEVFQVVGPRIFRFLRRMTGSKAFADDLVQETLLRMHQARGNFTPGMPVMPWAYTIARNCYLDAVRSAKRRPQLSDEKNEPSSPTQESADVSGADAEQELVARQTAHAVEQALAKMTAVRREAFVLLRYEGLSVAEAADVLGATEGAVKLRAFQAYKSIREALDTLNA